ncbi:MAG: GT4 family glycosyltransferase PelF [Candidatus Zapsychrus exili]|nr:GT4 family glycosyltransferase PelF [Candidatus Zapsychrus exili]
MNILQILPELNVGGVETGTVDFSKYLVDNNHKSVVISNGGAMVRDLEASGTKHYTLAVHKKSLWTIISMIKEVRKIIREEKIQIVHARSRVPGWIGYFACRKTKASFITTCHGYYKNKIFSQVMGWSKLVIVPSKVIGRHMIDDFKVAASSVRCIPRSVDFNRFNIERKKREGELKCTIAIVGRITPLKGHKYFLKAMARVVRNMPYAKIWIIGDAPKSKKAYKHELEVLVDRLGLKENVEFLGNRRDIPELLSSVDVAVLSTVTQEAFGRVILEAQAAGVPVVATKVGGVVDIIDDGETGLLVMPKDPEGMAKEVMRLLKDKNLSHRIVEKAKVKLRDKFTVEYMSSETLGVYEELLSSTNILVIKITSIGDVILATPSLKAIRENFPKAKIYCLVGGESRKILQNCPYLDGLIVYDINEKDKGTLNLFKLSSKLRKYRFDKVIDFQNNRKSHLLSFLSFPRESYGYDNGKWGFFLTNPLKKYRNDLPAVDHQFQLLNTIDIQKNENAYVELWPSKKDERYAQELLDSEWLGSCKNIVGINIAASKRWDSKNWPVEYIAQVCDILSNKNIRVIVTGMEKDRVASKKLLSLTKSKPAIIIGKTDIMQLAAIIKRCQVFITPDSAPMHLAAAMKVPCIALFGPTDSSRHIPPAEKIIVLEKMLKCSPCYSPSCEISTHDCMKEILPEEVVCEIEKLMELKENENSSDIDAS